MNKKREYKKRGNVDWYDKSSGIEAKHNQKDRVTGLYYNEIKGTWHSNRLGSFILKDSSIKLYDFKFYGLMDIKNDFGLKLYEKVGMFIKILYQKEMVSGNKVTDWEWIYWSRKDLDTVLGKHYWVGIIDKLIEKKLIKEDKKSSKYHVNKDVRYFMLDKGFIKVNGVLFKEVDFVCDSYHNRIKELFKKVIKERKGILKYIEKVMDESSLLIDELDEVINQIWLNKKAEIESGDKLGKIEKLNEKEYKAIIKSYYEYLYAIQGIKEINERRALYGLNRTKHGGRLMHMFSNAPKLFRKFLKIGGEEVVEIDIVSSQPSFLYVMMLRWYDFNNANRGIASKSIMYEEKFKLMAEIDKDLYKYMALKVKGLKHIGDEKSRKEMKGLFFRLIFGNPRYKLKGESRKDLICKIFGLDMYEFLIAISSVDMGYKKPTSNLATLLQKEESQFMDKVMDRLILEKLNFIPLYDSLIVRRSDADNVRRLFRAVIRDNNYGNILKIK